MSIKAVNSFYFSNSSVSKINFTAQNADLSNNSSQENTSDTKGNNKTALLITGLSILAAAGIYIATKGHSKAKAPNNVTITSTNSTIENSESLLCDMKKFAEKINSRAKNIVDSLELTQPKLKSEKLYNDLKEVPFSKNQTTDFQGGKLVDDVEKKVRKYIVGDKEVAIINYYKGEPYRFTYIENGQFAEEIGSNGSIRIFNNSDGKKTCAKYIDGKLEEYAIEQNGSTYSATVSGSKIRNAKLETFDSNHVRKKEYKMDFYADGNLERLYMAKLKPIEPTKASVCELTQARFYKDEVANATRTKYNPVDHSEISKETYSKQKGSI